MLWIDTYRQLYKRAPTIFIGRENIAIAISIVVIVIEENFDYLRQCVHTIFGQIWLTLGLLTSTVSPWTLLLGLSITLSMICLTAVTIRLPNGRLRPTPQALMKSKPIRQICSIYYSLTRVVDFTVTLSRAFFGLYSDIKLRFENVCLYLSGDDGNAQTLWICLVLTFTAWHLWAIYITFYPLIQMLGATIAETIRLYQACVSVVLTVFATIQYIVAWAHWFLTALPISLPVMLLLVALCLCLVGRVVHGPGQRISAHNS